MVLQHPAHVVGERLFCQRLSGQCHCHVWQWVQDLRNIIASQGNASRISGSALQQLKVGRWQCAVGKLFTVPQHFLRLRKG